MRRHTCGRGRRRSRSQAGRQDRPCRHVLQVAHVRRAGEALETALVVERLLDIGDRQAERPLKETESSGVHVAGARSHDEAFQRCHTHRSVHALSPVDRAYAGAIAQMHADNLQVGERMADLRCGAMRHIFMRGAMEAIAAESGVAPVCGDGVGRAKAGLVRWKLVSNTAT